MENFASARPVLTLVGMIGMSVAVASTVKPKRGYVADGHPISPASCNDPKLLSNMGWYYG